MASKARSSDGHAILSPACGHSRADQVYMSSRHPAPSRAKPQPLCPCSRRPRSSGSSTSAGRGQSGAAYRARLRRSVHPAGGRGAVRAGDRRRRQQGDQGPVRGRADAGSHGRPGRGRDPRATSRRIGLFRTKAKNVLALSRMLLERHGGEVPSDREALEALPGVGRKTANVVLNEAFGEPTIAVDTHVFRVANRTGLAPGANARGGRDRARAGRARAVQARRASLADPAWPLCLPRAASELPRLRRARSVPLPGQDPADGGPASQAGARR